MQDQSFVLLILSQTEMVSGNQTGERRRRGKKKLCLECDIFGCLCYGHGYKSQQRSGYWWGYFLPSVLLKEKQQNDWKDKSGVGDVLPIPGHSDSQGSLMLWLLIASHKGGFRYLLTWTKCWGNGHRERCQCSRKKLLATGTPSKKYLCLLPLLECPSGQSNSTLAQWEVLFIICNG